MFEDFITNARTDRYNLMCSLVAHDKIKSDYEDYGIIIGDRSITKDETTKELKVLGATINFIDIWLKLFLDNYEARFEAYTNAMKEMFNKIPQNYDQSTYSKEKSRNL